jgi:hypothetical protein
MGSCWGVKKMNETKVIIAQCLCGPKRHFLFGATLQIDPSRREEAGAYLEHFVREKIASLLQEKSIDPRCGICRNPSDQWQYNVVDTRFKTIEEANGELRRHEAAMIVARAAADYMRARN